MHALSKVPVAAAKLLQRTNSPARTLSAVRTLSTVPLGAGEKNTGYKGVIPALFGVAGITLAASYSTNDSASTVKLPDNPLIDPVPLKDNLGIKGTGFREGEKRWGDKDGVGVFVPPKTTVESVVLKSLQQQLSTFRKKSGHDQPIIVVVGGGEDPVGPRTNYGRGPVKYAQPSLMDSFAGRMANFQNTKETRPDTVFLVGEVLGHDIREATKHLHPREDRSELAKAVDQFEDRVLKVIKTVLQADKNARVMVLNGGHNLHRPLVFALSEENRLVITNVVDPHSDCRPLDVPHSGNHITSMVKLDNVLRANIIGLDPKWNNSRTYDVSDSPKVTWRNNQFIISMLNEKQFSDAVGRVIELTKSDIAKAKKESPDMPVNVVVSICGDAVDPSTGMDTSAGLSNKGIRFHMVADMILSIVNAFEPDVAVHVNIAEFSNELSTSSAPSPIGPIEAELTGDWSIALDIKVN